MTYKDTEQQKEYQRNWKRKRHQDERNKMLSSLGGKCVDCGNEDFRVLEIDHVEPVRRADRHFQAGQNTIIAVKKGILKLSELAVRCANCHKIKTYNDRVKFKNYINVPVVKQEHASLQN